MLKPFQSSPYIVPCRESRANSKKPRPDYSELTPELLYGTVMSCVSETLIKLIVRYREKRSITSSMVSCTEIVQDLALLNCFQCSVQTTFKSLGDGVPMPSHSRLLFTF